MSNTSPADMARQLGAGLLSFPVTHFDADHGFGPCKLVKKAGRASR